MSTFSPGCFPGCPASAPTVSPTPIVIVRIAFVVFMMVLPYRPNERSSKNLILLCCHWPCEYVVDAIVNKHSELKVLRRHFSCQPLHSCNDRFPPERLGPRLVTAAAMKWIGRSLVERFAATIFPTCEDAVLR